MFPRKFLGFRLDKLAGLMPQLTARSIDLIFAFDEANTRLAAAVQPSMFALYAAPAINLFEKTTDRVPVQSNQHEYHVVPDRSRYLDFEPHRILDMYAHFLGGREKVGCARSTRPPRARAVLHRPATAAPAHRGGAQIRHRLRLYRHRHVHLAGRAGRDRADPEVAELSVRALCSNRHLTEHLPVGEGGADFRLLDNVTLDVVCVAGPTPPREPIVRQLRRRSETAHTGSVTWRLINMLSLNHLGLWSTAPAMARRCARSCRYSPTSATA